MNPVAAEMIKLFLQAWQTVILPVHTQNTEEALKYQRKKKSCFNCRSFTLTAACNKSLLTRLQAMTSIFKLKKNINVFSHLSL